MTDKAEWTTRDELKFIDGLGTYSVFRTLTPAGRASLLVQYRNAMVLRSVWGEIEPNVVLSHVDHCIRKFTSPKSVVN